MIEHPRVVVSGSRVWGVTSDDPAVGSPSHVAHAERAIAHAVLNEALATFGHDMVIVHGAARGLDRLANAWAVERAIEVEPHPAPWKELGRKAGPFRNAQMIALRTELVIAFWTRSHNDPLRRSQGTGQMIAMAEGRGIPLWVYRSPWMTEDER